MTSTTILIKDLHISIDIVRTYPRPGELYYLPREKGGNPLSTEDRENTLCNAYGQCKSEADFSAAFYNATKKQPSTLRQLFAKDTEYIQIFFDILPYIVEKARGVHQYSVGTNLTLLELGEDVCVCILAASFLGIAETETSVSSILTHGGGTLNALECILNCFLQMKQIAYKFDGRVKFHLYNVKDANHAFLVKNAHGGIDLDLNLLSSAKYKLCPVNYFCEGESINNCPKSVHVDFANKQIGGPVFTGGFVQEEIMFLTTPFCLLGRVFCKTMGESDAYVITGARMFISDDFESHKTKGIAPTLTEIAPIIAIDANPGGDKVPRDLIKAIAGFSRYGSLPVDMPKVIATGNWGCGMFRGDPAIKFIIQWIAASVINQNLSLQYHLFNHGSFLPWIISNLIYRYQHLTAYELYIKIIRNDIDISPFYVCEPPPKHIKLLRVDHQKANELIAKYSICKTLDRFKAILKETLPAGMKITTLNHAIDHKFPEFLDLIPYLVSFAQHVWNMDIPLDVTYLNISEYQCMCILAASFLCIINPKRDSGTHPIDISFQTLFTWDKADDHFWQQVGKIRSILNCFYVMQQSEYRFDKRVVFRHVSVKTAECDVFGADGNIDEEKMQNHDGKMCPVTFIGEEVSIDTAKNAIQIDFANKYLGGGILSGGCVQEEIRFTVAPFCIIGHILCKIIAPNEAIAISGARIFSDSKLYGYGKGFTGPRPFTITNTIWNTDDVPTLIAIDAVRYERGSENTQYNKTEKLKALLKAIVGFASHKGATEYPNTRVIATGNWGAGAFNGDKILKFLIQWVAASVTNCESIEYHLWDDTEIVPYAISIADTLHGPLKNVYKLLMEYKKDQ